jgi:citrate synthase
MAQWLEWMNDEELRIVRPRQIYTGPRDADYVPLDERQSQPDLRPPSIGS